MTTTCFRSARASSTPAAQPVALLPWSRVRRDYKPETSGYYILHEGMLGFFDGSLKETTYDKAKSEGEKRGGIAYEANATGGWAGITDKYWLAAMIPDQSVPALSSSAISRTRRRPTYQVDYVTQDARTGRRAARHVEVASVRGRQGGAAAGSL